MLISNFRRKKILETLQSRKLTKDKKDEILEPYEDYIDRLLQQYQDQYEYQKSDQDKIVGLDLKRLEEEDGESMQDSEFFSARQSKKDPFGIKSKNIDLNQLKNQIL